MSDTDFDMPMTDESAGRVQRGVRRRRTFRALTAGGAAAATLGAAALVFVLVQPTPPDSPPGPPAASATRLDGFEITVEPEGKRVNESDSYYTSAVEENRLRNDGPAAKLDEPTAAVTVRSWDLGNGGVSLVVAVLRPERTTPEVSREKITQWLAGWSTGGNQPVETFGVPAGEAQLLQHVGSEVTDHEVLITTPDGVVISVSGAGAVPVTTLRSVAAGIEPR